MSFNKSVQKIFFMLAISISAVLLCLVGVWAATTNLNFHGKVSPDIHCKIVAGGVTIFDNNNSMGAQISSGNTLAETVTLSGSVTTAVTFQLTNYTPDKYIRLSVASISGATIKNDAVAVCAPTSQSSTPQSMTIHIAGASQSTATINLKVEEVYKVTVSGTGLATGAGNHFFAPSDARQITLEPAVGYQLPESLQIANSTHGEYRTKNTFGTVTVNKDDLLGNNVTITANCNQIFAVKQATAQSLGTAGDSFTIANDTTYLPNNGHYTYNNDSTTSGTLDNNFVEYPFYVEMGMYPQTEYATAPNGTYEIVKGKYYLYEAIKWIVLEALDKNGNKVAFGNLHYQNDMLYTDAACGKPFQGTLVLMSAYVLDASKFNDVNNDYTVNYVGSTVANNLNNFLGNKQTGANNGVKMNTLETQYAAAQKLTSIRYTGRDTYTTDTSLTASFFLPGGIKTLNSATTNESFVVDDYFKTTGIGEKSNAKTFNVGVASSTAFAIAKGVEQNSLTLVGGGKENATATRGWAIANDTNPISTSAYWTRSGGSNNGAIAINMNAITRNVLVENANVGIRPMLVLDLEFYATGTYTTPQQANA